MTVIFPSPWPSPWREREHKKLAKGSGLNNTDVDLLPVEVTAGSCATGGRKPRQARKGAAVAV